MVCELPLHLDEAELERVRTLHARVTGGRGHPLLSELATLCRQLLLKGCEVLERLPIDGEPSFLSEDDLMRALRAQVEERRARDAERARAFEVVP